MPEFDPSRVAGNCIDRSQLAVIDCSLFGGFPRQQSRGGWQREMDTRTLSFGTIYADLAAVFFDQIFT